MNYDISKMQLLMAFEADHLEKVDVVSLQSPKLTEISVQQLIM